MNTIWNANQPIAYLPESIRQLFLCEAGFLLSNLENNRLEVILVSAPEQKHTGHMIRVAVSHNPDWYSSLYWQYYPNFRRDRSLAALSRISNQQDRHFLSMPYKYDSIYRDLIYERLTQGYSEEGYFMPPLDEVCSYFGVNRQSIDDILG